MGLKAILAEETGRASNPSRGFSMGWPISIVAHVAVLAVLLWLQVNAPSPEPNPVAVMVSVLETAAPEAPDPPADDSAASGLPVEAPSEEVAVAEIAPDPTPPPEPVAALEPGTGTVATSAPELSDFLSDAQIAGAATAEGEGPGDGAGGGGAGGCNTAHLLQAALQRDAMVRRVVATSGRAGKAVMLWNGDWVRSGEQAGKGLSGVRQAITWELAFAPEICRNKSMRGLVLLSLADGTRFAIGTDAWRWSDLLGVSERDR